MSDGSLQVDPVALRQGATELRNHHFQLQESLSSIHAEHAGLRESWTGAASDHVASVWDDLRSRIAAHFGKLTTHATGLTTAANAYDAQDSDFSASINSVHSSLNLP